MEPFDFIHKKFGFGMMRLPMKDDEVDIEETCKMADAFMQAGFNYFDTAHGYLDGKSEKAVKTCVSDRYPRDSFVLTNKLTASYFNSQEEIRPLVEKQLEICGVDYFDFYLMHAQNASNFEKYKACKAYETAFELKKEGLLHHVGISFHDTAEVLENILTTYPDIEIVQIQFNYLDYLSQTVQSKALLEVCEKYNKPVIVMEPVKGGNLVNLPPEAQAILDDLQGGSNASYAIRFAASFDQVRMVLSGMSNLAQMEDNISYMKNFHPLSEQEKEAVNRVREVFEAQNLIPCTACHYCVEENHCPKHILIPEMFSTFNIKKSLQDWTADYYYKTVLAVKGSRASECLRCGLCERVCPQHLPIRDYLQQVSAEWDQ